MHRRLKIFATAIAALLVLGGASAAQAQVFKINQIITPQSMGVIYSPSGIATSTAIATTGPTVAYITGTSTTASSTLPHLVVSAISVAGEYISNFTTYVRSLFSAGTGIGISGTGVISNTGVTSIVAGTNITISGATGAVTINSSGSGGGGSGTVSTTSPGLTSGQPVYATGLSTIASVASSTFLTSLGLSLPVSIANGGTATNTQTTNGVDYFDGTQITSGANLSFNGTGTLTVGNNALGQLGSILIAGASGQPSFTFTSFNSSVATLHTSSSATRIWDIGNTTGSATSFLTTFGGRAGVNVTNFVGINATSTPGALLGIAGSAGGTTPLFMLSTSTAGFATSTVLNVDLNGQLQMQFGAVANPAYSFLGDTGTGFFETVAGTVSYASGGTRELFMNTSGIGGNSSDGFRLSASTALSATTPNIILDRADSTTGFAAGTLGNINVIVAGSEKARWTSVGYGVGTTTPWRLLSVGTGNVGTFAISTSTSGCAQFSALGELYSTGSTCGVGTVTSVTGTYPVISSGGATPAISLAFGTTTANAWSVLQTFANASSSLSSHIGTAWFGATATTTINGDGIGSILMGANSILKLGTTTAGTLSVSSTGVVYSGTAAGLSGSGAAGQATFWTGASAVSGDNNFFWDNTNKLLGIGSSTPSAQLTIQDNGGGSGTLVVYLWGAGGGGDSNGSTGGGGAGAFVKQTISSPAASYTGVIATGGAGGSSSVGGAGGTGFKAGGAGDPSNKFGGGGGGSTSFGTFIACGGGGANDGFSSAGATGTSGGAGGGSFGGGGGGCGTVGSNGGAAGGAGGTGGTSATGVSAGSSSGNSGGASASGQSGNGAGGSGFTGGAGSGGASGGGANTNGTAGTSFDSGGGGGGGSGSQAGNGGQPGAGGGSGGGSGTHTGGVGGAGEVIAVYTTAGGVISTTTITSTGAFTYTLPIARAPFTIFENSNVIMSIDTNGHLITGGSAPSCGAGCTSVQGDDNTIRVLIGSSVSTAVVNFGTLWAEAPVCIPTDMSGVSTGVEASTTVSAVTLVFPTALTSKYVGLLCQQSVNFTF